MPPDRPIPPDQPIPTDRRAGHGVVCRGESDSLALGARLAERAFAGLVVRLEGGLGMGKTVFARGFARGLGVEGPVVSPTYPIIQEYRGRLPLYHMDLYRLADADETAETGAAELLAGDGVCLVEWPERAEGLIGPDALTVRIERTDGGEGRVFYFDCPSADTWNRLGMDRFGQGARG